MRYREYVKLVLNGRTPEDAVIQFNIWTPAGLSAFIARAEARADTYEYHERLFNEMADAMGSL